MFDREKKGSIACSMCSTILRTLGQTFEENDLEELIKEIDADGKHTREKTFPYYVTVMISCVCALFTTNR